MATAAVPILIAMGTPNAVGMRKNRMVHKVVLLKIEVVSIVVSP